MVVNESLDNIGDVVTVAMYYLRDCLGRFDLKRNINSRSFVVFDDINKI